jgi:hypothetical protein
MGANWLAPTRSTRTTTTSTSSPTAASSGWRFVGLVRLCEIGPPRDAPAPALSRPASPAAYVNGMLAAGAGALVLMLFADWILPFVYNIQFVGFQASVLVWLFLGGLLVLDNQPERSHPNSL